MKLRERWDEYFHDYYFGYARRRTLKMALLAAAAVVVLIIGGVVALLVFGDESSSDSVSPQVTSPSSSAAPSTEDLTTVVTVTEPTESSSSLGTATSEPVDSTPPTTEVESTTSTTSSAPTTTTMPPSPTTTEPEAVTVATLPDGQPVPIVVVVDGDTVTLTGSVPSDAAADRIAFIAAGAGSSVVTVVNDLEVNPDVPINVGVRLLDLNSAGFESDSTTISEDFGNDLEYIATVMEALPRTSVMVIGHPDERGQELAEFALSEQRARALVSYLAFVGVAPDRVASRSVGDIDYLAIANDNASSALGGRAEFIFYGMLLE